MLAMVILATIFAPSTLKIVSLIPDFLTEAERLSELRSQTRFEKYLTWQYW